MSLPVNIRLCFTMTCRAWSVYYKFCLGYGLGTSLRKEASVRMTVCPSVNTCRLAPHYRRLESRALPTIMESCKCCAVLLVEVASVMQMPRRLRVKLRRGVVYAGETEKVRRCVSYAMRNSGISCVPIPAQDRKPKLPMHIAEWIAKPRSWQGKMLQDFDKCGAYVFAANGNMLGASEPPQYCERSD